MPLERYEFRLDEIAKFLLGKQGITDGDWEFGVNFDATTAFSAKSPEDPMLPTVMFRVMGLTLTRVDKKTPASIRPDQEVKSTKRRRATGGEV